MAASPPPPRSLSAGGGAHISLFLDTDLGTRLALNVAADSTIRGLKSPVAVAHAAAFPDLGPVAVKSFQVRRKGAMYHLSDSMAVRSAFSKDKAAYFLHVKMQAAETGAHCCRDEDRGKSSGGEDTGAWVTVHAHDVHPPFLLQQNTGGKSTAVCLATDVQTVSVPVMDESESYKQGQKQRDQTEGVFVNSTSVANITGLTLQNDVTLVGKEVHAQEEDMHSVGDLELGFVSGDKQMEIREEMLGELHALDDLSQEKDRKKARVTGSFDTSASDPVRETNDSKTRDVENFDKVPLVTYTNSREVLSNTSFQQKVDGNIKEDSIQLENPSLTGKNKKRKKGQLVKDVSAQLTEPSTGAVEVPKAIGEDLLHENQGLHGDGASNVEMTSRDKTKVIPPDMLLSSSQLNSGSQVTKHVQLGASKETSDLAADQSDIDPVNDGYRNLIVGDISISTCKIVAGEEKSAKGTNDGDHDESAVDASNMEKGSKRKDVLETLDNISLGKNCKQSKKVSSVGLTSMDTAEAKDQCRDGEKAGKPDTISTQQEIVNDPHKQQTASNVQQGMENPNGDVKRKKRRRQHPKSSKDDPTQDAAKSSGSTMNASSSQNTSSRCLDAEQITLGNIGEETADEKGNIGEETADEKDQCRLENVTEPVIISAQGMSVKYPSNVQQGDSDVTKNPNGDGKPKKKKRRHLESSKDTQDVTKSSGLITNGSSIQTRSADPLTAEQTTPGTIGEGTVSGCRKVDETVEVATTNVIKEVLADLRCSDNLSKVFNGDPLREQTKGGASAELPSAAIQSDPPISSPNHKSKGKPVKLPSIVHDPSHASVGVPDKNAYTELRESDSLRSSDKMPDPKDVLAESTAVPADGRTKSTKRQTNKVSLKHVPTDSGKAIQSLGEQVRDVPAEDLKGENCTKPELSEGGSAIDAPASTGQLLQKKSKRSSKTRAAKIEEVDHSTHGHENQFVKDSRQDKYVTDIGGTHNKENTVGAPTESPVRKDGANVTCEKPNARKAKKKSAKTELLNQDTNLEHGSDADLMNSRAQQGAVEPNDYVASVNPDNDKINFIDHFSPSVTNGPSDTAKNNDEIVREVKGKKKSKRKADTQPNDLPESHVHTDKASLAYHFGTGNVGVPSVSAENVNKEDSKVKKSKGKKKSKLQPDLIKPESLKPNGGNQDAVNCTQELMHSVVHKGMEQGNAKEIDDKVIQNDSVLQQETEDATRDSTLEKQVPQSMSVADSQTNMSIEKDHARKSKEQRNSTSQTKHHAKGRKHDGSIDGRTSTIPNAVSNPVQSFSMSPQASNESTYVTPGRFRVAVRKVPRNMHEQVKGKSKKDINKRGTGGIFGDTLSESSDEVLNSTIERAAMENSSSTSADSGISSAALYESDVPDDDGIASLSQKSDIQSILRGSASYKKARLKPTELLDDTEVPDSQPPF